MIRKVTPERTEIKFNLNRLDEFRKKVMGQNKPNIFCIPKQAFMFCCLALIDEDRFELSSAIADEYLVEIVDACADLIVVKLSFFCGLDIDKVLDEVHRSNMTKQGGGFNKAGKLQKPATYKPPDIRGVLDL